jgi:hypothetical protein
MSAAQSQLGKTTRDSLLAQIQELKALLAEKKQQLRQRYFARLEAEVGAELFQEMLRSREAAEQAVSHPEAKARNAALYLVVQHWGLGEQYAGVCESLAQFDPDLVVREQAVCLLSAHIADRDNARVGRLLARMVPDEAEPASLRLNAFRGLICLRGLELDWRPRLNDLRFPDDVDWAFVASFDAPGPAP